MKKDLAWFRANRPKQYDAAIKLIDNMISYDDNGNIAIKSKYAALWAPLKWGKREVLDIMSLMLRGVEFIYLAPPYKSLNTQRDELYSYGWGIDDRKDNIIKKHDLDKKYVVAFDEADWGDGKCQQFHKRFNKIKDLPNVILFGISATNFTFVSNLEKRLSENCVVGEKYPIYKGLEHFPIEIVEEGAIKKDGTFTKTFEKIIRNWLKEPISNDKLKFIVRETGFSRKEEEKGQVVEKQLRKLCKEECGNEKIDLVMVDKDHGYKWKRGNDDSWRNGGRELFIVKQTFARATETDIQKFLYGYYDFRGELTPLSTITQALGRFPNYNGICDIKLFISEDHKNKVDIYIEIEKEILSGKSLLSVLDEHNDKDINYTGKFKGIGPRESEPAKQWIYNWDNPIIHTANSISNIEDFENFNKEVAPSTRDRIYQGMSKEESAAGRWNGRENGKTYDKMHVIFNPNLTSFSDLDKDQKDFLIYKGIWTILEKGNFVAIEAVPKENQTPIDTPKNTAANITDKSCYGSIINQQ